MLEDKKIVQFEKWLDHNNIEDVEIMVSDFAGISRGKMVPKDKFIEGLRKDGLRMPENLFSLTIDCDFIGNDFITDVEEDLYLIPDINTLTMVPWNITPTACVVCDLVKDDGSPTNISPRQVLINVLKLYKDKGWKAKVAPEFEFFLLANQADNELAPCPPTGRSGKQLWDKGLYSMDGTDDFSELFEDVYQYCEIMNIPIDTLTQEAGPAQFEINMHHNDPLKVADQAFYFKRLIKQAAIRRGVFVSFMAKPYPDEFGSAMHIHQSVLAASDGKSIFADKNSKDTALFLSHIAGLQKYIPALMPIFAPYANSYLRFGSSLSSPANLHWGLENRSVGLRVPAGDSRSARRVENRIAGSDVNPYLVIAASLLAGYLGMIENLKPSKPLTASAYDLESFKLPEHFLTSLNNFTKSKLIKKMLSEEFVTTFADVKKKEYLANFGVLSPWEIRYLLMNV